MKESTAYLRNLMYKFCGKTHKMPKLFHMFQWESEKNCKLLCTIKLKRTLFSVFVPLENQYLSIEIIFVQFFSPMRTSFCILLNECESMTHKIDSKHVNLFDERRAHTHNSDEKLLSGLATDFATNARIRWP